MKTRDLPATHTDEQAVRESTSPRSSALPGGFDVQEWTRQACEASGVPFAVTDPVALERLRTLVAHPA